MLPRALVLSVIIHLIIYLGCISLELPLLPGVVTNHQVLSATLKTESVPRRSFEHFPANSIDQPERPSHQFVATKTIPHLSTVFPINSLSTVATDFHPDIAANYHPETGRAEESASILPIGPKEALNPEGLGIYRLNLAREARRFKRYPAIARERSWEGVVVMKVQARIDSVIPLVSIGSSSGHDVLDAQAQEMLLQAVRQALLPESLRGRQFAINVPIHFRLAD